LGTSAASRTARLLRRSSRSRDCAQRPMSRSPSLKALFPGAMNSYVTASFK
jgi:hypothetical protein